jgi:hypothetical protein
MTSIAFEAALSQPDDDPSNFRLFTLISARDYSGPTLPAVAESYLRAFCEITPSVIRRRWIGIALAGMMGQSPAVVANIRQMGRELQRLGAIILSHREQEETKVIAGIIMRQGLEHGIEYGSFWDSDKVKNSAPNFPDNKHDARWMQMFQKFMDTLAELALANTDTDASIIFPVSLVTSDDFRWRESSNGLPVAIIQSNVMTIIAPNEDLEEIQFVDIPLSHIWRVRSEPAKLHDSQAQETEYKPWDVVLTLRTEPWSYRLNSAQRSATNISLLFTHSADAEEWKGCIEEHGKEPKVHPMMSRSSPIATSSSSAQDLTKQKPISRSQPLRISQSTAKSPLVRSRPSHVEKQAPPEHASPKTLPGSKRATYSKGKLPRISQATKQKALKQLRAPPDDLDIPMDGERTEQIDSHDASSLATSSSERPQPSRTTFSHAATKVKKTRKSQTKHKADDDEDFVPIGPKPKKKTNAKRKSAPDVVADSKPAKKARTRPVNDAKATATGPSRQTKPKSLAQPSSSVASSHRSLIGGLLGSQMLTKTSGVPFKKPELPARTAQTPSTPTKPRKRTAEVLARPQTPTDARMRYDDEALPLTSSPPSHYVKGDRSDRIRRSAAETEILSSNSKPVPASPNAESTAISGHADRDDVASEKRTGDYQTAKSDPFTQRTDGRKKDAFTRRLTDERSPNANIELTIGLSPSVRAVNGAKTSMAKAASQPVPQPMPWHKKPSSPDIPVSTKHSVSGAAKPRKPTVGTKIGSPQITDQPTEVPQPKQDANILEVQESKRQVTPTLQQNCHQTSANVAHNSTQQASIEVAQDTTTPSQERSNCSREESGVGKGDSILDAPEQVIDDTQAEQTAQGNNMDLEGDTLPGEYVEDEQPATESKASPVNFRSSPPMPGSPSSHSSTSAELEPRTDPPLQSSQAEEMEWEASLQPHQRALHDLLLRTSKQVMCHIIDNETGVTDIADTFAEDGEHVLNSLLQRHDGDYDDVFQDMESKKKGLQRELERATKQMEDERERVHAMI